MQNTTCTSNKILYRSTILIYVLCWVWYDFLEPYATNTNQNSEQYFGQYKQLNVDLWGYVKL